MIKQKRSNGATFHFHPLTGGARRTARGKKGLIVTWINWLLGSYLLLPASKHDRHIWAENKIACCNLHYHKLFHGVNEGREWGGGLFIGVVICV